MSKIFWNSQGANVLGIGWGLKDQWTINHQIHIITPSNFTGLRFHTLIIILVFSILLLGCCSNKISPFIVFNLFYYGNGAEARLLNCVLIIVCFQPPQKANGWPDTFQAVNEGNVCVQSGREPKDLFGNENCLYLNVFTPVVSIYLFVICKLTQLTVLIATNTTGNHYDPLITGICETGPWIVHGPFKRSSCKYH